MFIHPTQNRTFTPREAARIQSFPDWFRFPKARTHAFRLIGNAVPPLIGEAVGLAVRRFLDEAGGTGGQSNHRCPPEESRSARFAPMETGRRGSFTLPANRPAAAVALQDLATLDRRSLRALSKGEFLRGWHALLFLFPCLHPENAKDHGESIEQIPTGQLGLPGFEKRLERRHVRSGWPVALALIGQEALRRYETDSLTEGELYCVAAQRAGLLARNAEVPA